MQPSVLMIMPYFGTLPEYFDLWLESAALNRDVDWLIISDQHVSTSSPNVTVLPSSLESVKRITERKLGFPVSLAQPYKLCDFKSAYGRLFGEQIEGYSYWGHGDFDVIWGDMSPLFSLMEGRPDRIFGGGHLSLYRNDPEVNAAFELVTAKDPISYRKVFSSPDSYAFDEWGPNYNGMNAIMLEHGFDFYLESMPYADIKVHGRGLRTNREGFGGAEEQKHEMSKRNIAYSFEDGVLRQHWISRSGTVEDVEEIYIHLQKRHVDRTQTPLRATSFMILPPGRFVPLPPAIDSAFLEKHAREEGIYWPSVRIRIENVRRKLIRQWVTIRDHYR